MIEPDEDEDPTRLCAKCGVRPRWSKHGTCRNCAACTGKKLRAYILHRKNDEPPKKVVQDKSVQRRMARYHELRRRGLSCEQARAWSTSAARFDERMRDLTRS